MIKNKEKLSRFYEGLLAEERLSYRDALSIYEALHREAVALGIIGSKNILEGLEVDLQIARAIHSLKK